MVTVMVMVIHHSWRQRGQEGRGNKTCRCRGSSDPRKSKKAEWHHWRPQSHRHGERGRRKCFFVRDAWGALNMDFHTDTERQTHKQKDGQRQNSSYKDAPGGAPGMGWQKICRQASDLRRCWQRQKDPETELVIDDQLNQLKPIKLVLSKGEKNILVILIPDPIPWCPNSSSTSS